MANKQTGESTNTGSQQSTDKKKGFEEGNGNNNTTAGLNQADSQKKNPSPQSMDKSKDKNDKERAEDRSVMQDDEDVEESK